MKILLFLFLIKKYHLKTYTYIYLFLLVFVILRYFRFCAYGNHNKNIFDEFNEHLSCLWKIKKITSNIVKLNYDLMNTLYNIYFDVFMSFNTKVAF